MQDRIANTGRILASLLASAALAGCSSANEHSIALFADPSQYLYHNCQQLAAAHKSTQSRRAELQGLIDKADQGAAGVVVSTVVYRGEHRSAGEELVVIERAQRAKNCPADPNTSGNPVAR